MVRNKRELILASGKCVSAMLKDLRRQAYTFMEKTGANEEILAELLDTDADLVRGVLDGSVTDIPVSLLSKILVGTGHAVVVIPAANVPQMGMGPSMPPMGCMCPNMPACDLQGCELDVLDEDEDDFDCEEEEDFVAPPRHIAQPRDSRGRFMRRRDNPSAGVPMPPRNCGEVDRREVDAEDQMARKLARALRNNPEITNIFKQILNQD